MKKSIFNYNLKELEKIVTDLGHRSFVAKQIWSWLYCSGVQNFDSMSNVAKTLREQLTTTYSCSRPTINKNLVSEDGTQKWLLEFEDKNTIELVYIPAEDRGTLCLSTQVGCPMGCRFCNTGSQGFTRNLTVAEIVQEMLVAKDTLEDWKNKAIGEGRKITNLVFMGMGEPLLNYDNVIKAIHLINDENGMAFSNRRITLSTCGIVPKIYDLANDLKINLAISLHASDDSTRKKLMPIAEKYNMDELLRACANYAKKTNYRRITFEYIMIDGINDAMENAKKLLQLIRRYEIPAKFNLIPFNPWRGCPFKNPSDDKKVSAFAKYITDRRYPCPIRFSRGSDIMAACGQLKSEGK